MSIDTHTVFFLVFYVILLTGMIKAYQSNNLKYIKKILIVFVCLLTLALIMIVIYVIRDKTICDLTRDITCKK